MLWTKPIKPRAHKVLKYLYFCDKTHPLADKCGIVYHHRHVASEKIGRWLLPDEHVHHIDRDKQNNDPLNLQVMSKSEHAASHKPIVLPRACKSCGKVFKPRSNKINYCSAKHAIEAITVKHNLDYIKEMVWKIPSSKLADELGISDTGLCKICKRNNIDKPPVGYWSVIKSAPKVHTCKKYRSPPGLVHGTNTGYTKHACRCDACREAHRVEAVRRSNAVGAGR